MSKTYRKIIKNGRHEKFRKQKCPQTIVFIAYDACPLFQSFAFLAVPLVASWAVLLYKDKQCSFILVFTASAACGVVRIVLKVYFFYHAHCLCTFPARSFLRPSGASWGCLEPPFLLVDTRVLRDIADIGDDGDIADAGRTGHITDF